MRLKERSISAVQTEKAREQAFACDEGTEPCNGRATEPVICRLYDEACKELDHLADRVEELEKRLDKVVPHGVPSGIAGTDGPQPIESPLATGMRHIAARARGISNHVSSIIDRLEC